jgi:glutamyl-Q tRNA(Asp) synthetase
MTDPGSAGQGAGRFAPSPTGPLHLGSLLAATASYLDARSRDHAWHVRLDDLDRLRNEPGAERAILGALESHGLHWDGAVTRQSEQLERYAHALAALEADGSLFYCRCSRKRLQGAPVYPGSCRAFTRARPNSAARIRVNDTVIEFNDLVRGPQSQALGDTTGDFVVRRRDGIFAYQLATAADDGAPGITRVIRGRDLLDVTGPQIFLMRRLGLTPPVYGHIPLFNNEAGQKLSKQNHAPPLNDADALRNLALVLAALGLDPGPAAADDCTELLAWAVPRFSLERVAGRDHTVSKHDAFVTITRHDPGTHRRT